MALWPYPSVEHHVEHHVEDGFKSLECLMVLVCASQIYDGMGLNIAQMGYEYLGEMHCIPDMHRYYAISVNTS